MSNISAIRAGSSSLTAGKDPDTEMYKMRSLFSVHLKETIEEHVNKDENDVDYKQHSGSQAAAVG